MPTILLCPKKLRRILHLLSLKLMIESKLLSIKVLLVKVTVKVGQEKFLLSILLRELILRLMKLKNRDKIIGSFYEKELLRSIL